MTWSSALFDQDLAYSAQDLRQLMAMVAQPGVLNPDDFVCEAGSGMNSLVGGGRALVANSYQVQGGLYLVRSDADTNVLHQTADPTNSRLDQVYIKVFDSVDGGDSSDTAPAPDVLVGIPQLGNPSAATLSASRAGAGALPNNTLWLYDVYVPNGSSGGASAAGFTYYDQRTYAGTSTGLSNNRSLTPGSSYQPGVGRATWVIVPVTFALGPSGGDADLTAYIGPTSGSITIQVAYGQYAFSASTGGTISTQIAQQLVFRVPPGWYYKVTETAIGSGVSVNLASAEEYAV